MSKRPSRGWIETLFDAFEVTEVEMGLRDPIAFPGYPEAHRQAAATSGNDESVIPGVARIGEVEVSAVVFEFDFLGGSVGEVAGARIEAAMMEALRHRRPFLAVTSTGGARMQEGMAALAQMARTSSASAALAQAGIPRISVLGDPTTGGVYASFASLSDFVIAEAQATIGFAGPRVAQAIEDEPIPAGSHTAEAASEAGLVDGVLTGDEIKGWLQRLLYLLDGRGPPSPIAPSKNTTPNASSPPAAAFGEYRLARHPDRPRPRFYLEQCLGGFLELHGDRAGADDPAVIVGLGAVGSTTVVAVALDRDRPSASGYRKARRGIDLAGRLGFPLVTLVDTPGADASSASEYSGLASEIARTFHDLLTVQTPVVSLITGEGGSGGALALACGDAVAVQTHAVFSVIAPEGAAAILHRDPSRAEEVAGLLRPTSHDLVALGIADGVVWEPSPGAHTDPEAAARAVTGWLEEAVARTEADTALRADRFRDLRPLGDSEGG